MTKTTIAKFAVATILGITAAHFWSIGEPRISIFMIATIIFQIFFIVGEEQKQISESEFQSMFAKEMQKYQNSKIFDKN